MVPPAVAARLGCGSRGSRTQMTLVTYVYIAIYALVALQGIREDLRFGVPLWKAALSTVANALGVAGMLLYLAPRVDPSLVRLWAWVCLLLVVEALVQLRFSYRSRYRRVLPDGEPGDAQLRSLLWSSVLVNLLAAAPCYTMNFALALGLRL
jgi:hypothetical protein